MKTNRLVCCSLLALMPMLGYAAPKSVDHVYPKVCKQGVHAQPGGQFAAYVFCDDALGSNIAVMHVAPGDSEYPKWPIDQRFWQGQLWAKDVDSIGWVPRKDFLVVATTEIYGEGSVFLLDLVNQTSSVLTDSNACRNSLVAVSEKAVTVKRGSCEDDRDLKTIVLTLPPGLHSNR